MDPKGHLASQILFLHLKQVSKKFQLLGHVYQSNVWHSEITGIYKWCYSSKKENTTLSLCWRKKCPLTQATSSGLQLVAADTTLWWYCKVLAISKFQFGQCSLLHSQRGFQRFLGGCVLRYFCAADDREFRVETGNPESSPWPVRTHLGKMAAPMLDSPGDGWVDE